MPIFAFTDIEGSTGMWERYQDAMGPIIAKHYAILETSVARFGGKIVKKTGDGIFAIFPDESGEEPSAALSCALEMQRRFQDETWPVIGELRVRMGFHCGQAEEQAGDYYGPTANRTARFMSLGWGGQVLVSEDLRKVAVLPEGATWSDLGVHMVKDLPEPQHVFSLTHPSLHLQEFPDLKSLSNRPHNLPEQLSAFVGRQKELRDLGALLTGPQGRLVTLLGGGGMGKSRLAIQGALENLGAFKHGVTRVGLEGLSSPDQVAGRIAAALKIGLYRQGDPREQLLDYLKDRKLLLILDPCERFAGSAALISELLAACPGLHVLACSRRRLDLRGESVLEVRGLECPIVAAEGLSSSGCARLFVREVQALQPGYTLKPEEEPYFLRLCRALRGMPLGLELAAAWMKAAPLKVLAERLEKDPRFLTSTRQDLPVAHRSLKALFESAWAQLPVPERNALAGLAVFSGGFSLAAAQRAAQASPEILVSLVEQGLLEDGEAGRFAIPDATRLFAALKLEELPELRDAALDQHARYYCRLLKERERNLMGHEQVKAVAELRQEYPNIVRAWDRAVAQAWVRELGQAARGLGLYTSMQGLARESEPRMERALQLWEGPSARAMAELPPEEALSSHAAVLASLADYAFSLGKGAQAREKMEKSLALARKAGNRQASAYALVRAAIFLGPEDERRRPALEEATGIYHALGDSNGVAWARRNLGYLLCLQGQAKEGKPMLEESLAIFRKVGNQREIAWSLNSLGQLALETGQAEAGAKGLREARDIFLQLGDLETAAWTLSRLGRAAMKQQQWDEARTALEESLRLFGQIRHFRGRAQAMRSLCELFAGQGDLPSAYVVVDKAIAEAQSINDLGGQAGAMMQKGQLLAGQGHFDEALALMQAAQAAFAKAGSDLGQALAIEGQGSALRHQKDLAPCRRLFEAAAQAFAKAGIHDGEARLYVRLGDLDVAEAKANAGEGYYKRALKISRQTKPGDYSLGALLGMAALYHKAGRKLEALHLALLCERALGAGMLPPSEPEFHAELAAKVEAVLAQIGSKLLHSVIEEARAKMAGQDPRALLKECLEKNQ